MIMFEELKKVLSKQLRVDESKITLASKLKEDLGADSLDLLELLMTLETDHGIVVPDEELIGFITVGDVVSYIDGIKK